MPGISLPEPPEPFSCKVCESPEYFFKEGPACEECPALKGYHYFPRGEGHVAPDVLFVGDVPEVPSKHRISGDFRDFTKHFTFSDDAGRVVKNAVEEAISENSDFKWIKTRYVYGVKCAIDNPTKKIIQCCQTPLSSELSVIHQARIAAGKVERLVIVAHGLTGLRALGLSVAKAEDAAGRVFEIQFGNIPITVVATMSLKAIAAAVGKYSSVKADILRAFSLVISSKINILSREELEKGYIYPKTLDEVKALINKIEAYTEGKNDPTNWLIAFDTETNTLHPHRDGLQVLNVSFAWGTGMACAIPLWHEENTAYDPAEAWKEVQRLLEGSKPKVGHNLKYDCKVVWKQGGKINNIRWDTYHGEHALEEDKKGQYNLKYLVRQYLPEYSGYEDKLHEILEKTEGEDQRKSIKTGKADKELSLPKPIAEALERLMLQPKFKATTLEKKIKEWEGEEQGQEKIKDAKLLLAAKKAGEFTQKSKKKKVEVDEGFKKIPLKDLLFYAAVDADVTRQLTINQSLRMHKEDFRLFTDRDTVSRDNTYQDGIHKKEIKIRYKETSPLQNLVKNGYVPRLIALGRMEYFGVKVNQEYLNDSMVKLERVVAETEEEIYKLAGDRFKIGSGAQLGRYLFNTGIGFVHPNQEAIETILSDPLLKSKVTYANGRLMYKPVSYTKLGAAQTNEATLKAYVSKYKCPFSNLILTYKKAIKAKDTFLTNVRDLSLLDGFLHTSYNQNGTGTGRLSSSNMNMQNVPKGEMGTIPDNDPRALLLTPEQRKGVKCKRLFIPDDDSNCFFNIDAKGAEVTIFGSYAEDDILNQALREGRDMHSFFASKVLNPVAVAGELTGDARRHALEKAGIDDEHGWTYEDFVAGKEDLLEDKKYCERLKKLRDNVKRVVFGILYGAGYRKIAEIAGIDEGLAKTIIQLLFELFPAIPFFIEQIKWELNTFGLVETYHGRRRRFLIRNAPKKLRAQAERRVVNFEIQGENSDIVLDTLVAIDPIIRYDFGGKLLLTVHDSIGGMIPKKYTNQFSELIDKYGTQKTAEKHPWLQAPYRWDKEMGVSYGDLLPIDTYLKGIKDEVTFGDLAGYTEEEMYEDLRNAVLIGGD